MAEFYSLNKAKKYHDDNARQDVINYITNPEKAGYIVCSGQLDHQHIADDMDDTAQMYNKDYGVRLHHLVLSYGTKDHCTPDSAYMIADEVTEYLGKEYQTVTAVHEDKNHLHMHVVFNAVSTVDGTKYHGSRQDFKDLESFLKKTHSSYGMNIHYVSKKELEERMD